MRKQKTIQRLMADVLLASVATDYNCNKTFCRTIMQKRMDDFMLGRVFLAQLQRDMSDFSGGKEDAVLLELSKRTGRPAS